MDHPSEERVGRSLGARVCPFFFLGNIRIFDATF